MSGATLPEFLKKELSAQYSAAEIQEIMQGYGASRPVSFRVNPLRCAREDALASLRAAGIELHGVSWYADAFYTYAPQEELRRTPLYENGAIYLQSLSSMLPPLALGAGASECVLDMTAAPGGKTTQISALANGEALITACEKDGGRFSRLEFNVKKQGAPRVTLMKTDAARLDDYFRFDKILLDAPCSGSGTVNTNQPVKINEKTFFACLKTQEALARKAWRLLKKGGVLVYSTCSILKRENDEILAQILKNPDAELLPLPFERGGGATGDGDILPAFPRSDNALCVKPTALFEGFFLAKIRKH